MRLGLKRCRNWVAQARERLLQHLLGQALDRVVQRREMW